MYDYFSTWISAYSPLLTLNRKKKKRSENAAMSTRVLGDAVSEQALQETRADREKKKGALTDS